MSRHDVTRYICRLLDLAAQRLEIDFDCQDGDVLELCRRIVAARYITGRVNRGAYRVAFWIANDLDEALKAKQ